MYRELKTDEIYPDLNDDKVVYMREENLFGAFISPRKIDQLTMGYIKSHRNNKMYIYYETKKLFNRYCELVCDENTTREDLVNKMEGKKISYLLSEVIREEFNKLDTKEKIVDNRRKIFIEEIEKTATETSLDELIRKYSSSKKESNNIEEETVNNKIKEELEKTLDIPSFANNAYRKRNDEIEEDEIEEDETDKKTKKRRISGVNKKLCRTLAKVGLAVLVGFGTAEAIYNHNNVTSYKSAEKKDYDYTDFLKDNEPDEVINYLIKEKVIDKDDEKIISTLKDKGTIGLYEDINEKSKQYKNNIPKINELDDFIKETTAFKATVDQNEVCDGYNNGENGKKKATTYEKIVEQGYGGIPKFSYVFYDEDSNEIGKIVNPVKTSDYAKYNKKQEELEEKINSARKKVTGSDITKDDENIKKCLKYVKEFTANTLDRSTQTMEVNAKDTVIKLENTSVKDVEKTKNDDEVDR